MNNILLFGASGQVGSALQRSAPADVNIISPTSSEVDMRDARAVRAAMQEHMPDTIINCAAFTRVDDAEVETESAYAINADAPRVLAAEAVRSGARLLHVSTDYVFSGNGHAPFGIQSPADPISVYGASKLAGEVAVLSTDPNAAVVRTAWVHSGGAVNFIATAVRVLKMGTVLRVVDDQVSTPTRAAHLASALWTLATKANIHGLLHFTDAGVASWYDVAECVLETLLAEHAAGDGAAVIPVDSSEFPRQARRPCVSLLDKHSTWRELGITPPHWRTGVIASTKEILFA
ncbi:MAG: dTDP-4-dehydrorhamnose reductase [Gemmatimonadaceae bacterium]